jgi:hypothetical protein
MRRPMPMRSELIPGASYVGRKANRSITIPTSPTTTMDNATARKKGSFKYMLRKYMLYPPSI